MSSDIRRPTRIAYVSVDLKPGQQWRTQDFRMGGVELPQAPKGVGSGEGIPPLHWGKDLAPPPQKILRIFVENTIL